MVDSSNASPTKPASAPFPDDLDVDDDGYPAEDKLRQIREARDVTGAAHWMRDVFPRLVESMPCGHADVMAGKNDFGRPICVVRFSTGGWSGQEDFIDAVEGSILGLFYLWSWRRGGHYEFRIPTEQSEGAA